MPTMAGDRSIASVTTLGRVSWRQDSVRARSGVKAAGATGDNAWKRPRRTARYCCEVPLVLKVLSSSLPTPLGGTWPPGSSKGPLGEVAEYGSQPFAGRVEARNRSG